MLWYFTWSSGWWHSSFLTLTNFSWVSCSVSCGGFCTWLRWFWFGYCFRNMFHLCAIFRWKQLNFTHFVSTSLFTFSRWGLSTWILFLIDFFWVWIHILVESKVKLNNIFFVFYFFILSLFKLIFKAFIDFEFLFH